MKQQINVQKFYEEMCNSIDLQKLLEDQAKDIINFGIEYSVSCPVCKKIIDDFDLHMKEMKEMKDIEHIIFYVHES